MKTGYSFGSLVSFTEALDKAAVKITGDQTIAGVKTFSSNPISSAAQGTGGSHLTRKDYVDGALALKAPLASPALTGTPTAPTAAEGTNTTQLATTAFVTVAIYNKCSDVTPLMNGAAAIGTSTKFTREDHVHPTDTSRAPLASPALTGTPTAPTAVAGTNTTQLATTAFVQSMKIEVAKMLYPVGSYYANDSDSTNPATLFGFGTWVRVEGRVLMGCDGTGAGTFGTPGAQSGALTHAHTAYGTAITIAQMPIHGHSIAMGTSGIGDASGGDGRILTSNVEVKEDVSPATYISANDNGSGQAHTHTIANASSLPPYRVVYLWRRTA